MTHIATRTHNGPLLAPARTISYLLGRGAHVCLNLAHGCCGIGSEFRVFGSEVLHVPAKDKSARDRLYVSADLFASYHACLASVQQLYNSQTQLWCVHATRSAAEELK